jgi:hypothetical protein
VLKVLFIENNCLELDSTASFLVKSLLELRTKINFV